MTTEHQIKVRVGRVISDKMDKTIIVTVERRYSHPLYKKILRRTNKYKVHNEGNVAKAGDIVRIVETRPLSKEKRWRVAEILSKGEMVVLPKEVVEAPPVEKIEPVIEQVVGESAAPGVGTAGEIAPAAAEPPAPAPQ